MSKENNRITVPTLLNLYANSLSSTMDGQLIIVEGFFSDNNNKLYGQYYYDEIISKEKQHRITIQVTQSVKSKLAPGSYYNFQGYVTRGQSLDNSSRLSVYFRVTKILEHKEEVQIVSKVEYDIIRARFDREFPIIQDVLLKKIEREQKPTLDIITGIQSTSQEDYSNQLQDRDYYNIRHHQCNLTSSAELVNFLGTHDFNGSDLIIILRGGGSGLEIFNEIELCRKAIELPIPFITGIGHEQDKTLLQRVADMGLSTPTAVGTFLQKIVNSHKERLKLIANKDSEMQIYKKAAESEKLLLMNQIASQKRSLNLFMVIVIVLIFAVLYLILKGK
ncbi:exodeoxyribonuclease VII large subunit [Gaetbulibacter sp. M235]|uniref:exodeoxyribonuclease VII large subunit n=1 Tax=Gaetbulibacter sp. M235 TaxID=3126510 RepID=UPI00374EB19C